MEVPWEKKGLMQEREAKGQIQKAPQHPVQEEMAKENPHPAPCLILEAPPQERVVIPAKVKVKVTDRDKVKGELEAKDKAKAKTVKKRVAKALAPENVKNVTEVGKICLTLRKIVKNVTAQENNPMMDYPKKN